MVFLKTRSSVFVCSMALLSVMAFLTGCVHKKYDNPISKDTQQPDKVLFDKAIGDIEHGRYEVARLTLNTMINTYDTSEYLAKAKLAVADSWYREGGAHGLAQAEAEYKDFILFYPQMEEAAESQWKVCQIHYRQMEKPDRDPTQAQRAEDECRQVMVQFPNSKFVPQAQQYLRNIQEVLAEKEFLAGSYYHARQAFPAASARLSYVVDQYPLFSQADEALWELADSYNRLGDRWEDKAAQAYTKIVKDYPLSIHAEEAAAKLKDMKRPVPEADPAAVARMKFEEEHRMKTSMMGHMTGPMMGAISHSPDVKMAAKSGAPAMETLRPPTPISVPAPAGGVPGTSGGEVTVSTAANSDIDSKPDARAGGAAAATPAAGTPGSGTVGTGTAPANNPTGTGPSQTGNVPTNPATGTPAGANGQPPLPTNYQTLKTKQKKSKKDKKQQKNAATDTTTASPASSATPASTDSSTPKTDTSK